MFDFPNRISYKLPTCSIVQQRGWTAPVIVQAFVSMKTKCGFWCVAVLVCCGGFPLWGQTIDDFNPKVGTTNDSIIITGSGFLPSTGLHVQFWDRKSATFIVNSDQQLTASVPAGTVNGAISIYRSGATNFTASNFLMIGHGPYITDFSPTFGSVNDTITLNGVHLTNASAIKFGGVSSTSITFTADGMLATAKVPLGASNGLISVTTSFGSYTNPTQFMVVGAGPAIFGFDPPSGPGNSVFTIQGVHFLTGVTNVKVNGTNVFSFHVQSDQQIQATNRSDVSTGLITIKGPQGSATSAVYFYVPPVVSSFSPTNGIAGTSVTITGQNFLGTSNVQFDGINAFIVQSTNNSTLIVNVPTGMVQSARIRVATPGGVQFSGPNFRMLPVITGFTPAVGRLNTNVTISGAALNEGLVSVKFNGTNASFNPPTYGQVVAMVPAGAASGPITITTSNGTVSSVTNFFLPAGITSFTPTNGPENSPIQIFGTNFLGATAITFNGAVVNISPATSNTFIQTTIPTGVTTGPLGVTTPFGTSVNTNLTFYAVPVITGFSPTHGLPNTSILISGTNFFGASSVRFNGTNANFTYINNGQISALVPTNAFNGPISVTAPAGTGFSGTPFQVDFTSDISVQLIGSPNPVFIGSNLIYTITVSNAGPYSAANVALSNTLPASVILQSTSSSSGTLNTNTNSVVGNWATLNSAGSATVTVVVVPQTVGNITDSAIVGSSYTDPVLANNSGAIITTVYPLPVLSVQIYSPSQVQLSWPAMLTNFVLQYNGALSTNNSWSNVVAVPLTVGDQKVVIDSIGPAPKYYRLKF
jgi:uncharacterized repeat protein (TIGR01451 family)